MCNPLESPGGARTCISDEVNYPLVLEDVICLVNVSRDDSPF